MQVKDDAQNSDVNMVIESIDDGSFNEESSETVATGKQFNISARRRIEEYHEGKRLASLTTDYYLID